MKKIMLSICSVVVFFFVNIALAGRPPIDLCKGKIIDDGKACTMDRCDPASGIISHPVACPSGATCDAKGACATIKIDKCKGVNVDDGKACTADKCNPATGQVSHVAACPVGASCNANGACETADKCKNNPNVDDKNACTVDTCDPYTGAVWHASIVCPGSECDKLTGKCFEHKCHDQYAYSENIVAQDPVSGISHQCPTGALYTCHFNDQHPELCPEGWYYNQTDHTEYSCIIKGMYKSFSGECMLGYVKKIYPFFLSTHTKVTCSLPESTDKKYEICGGQFKPTDTISSMGTFCCAYNPLPPACDNGQLDFGESCDGDIIGVDSTCESNGYKGGKPECFDSCYGASYYGCIK